MYARKTWDLQAIALHYILRHLPILYIIFSDDKRYCSSELRPLNVSHDGTSIHAVRAKNFAQDPPELTPDIKAVFVDEGQFFSHLGAFCQRMRSRGISVYIAGLNSDFHQKPWSNIMEVMPALATKVTIKAAVCICCGDAAYCTRKIAGSKDVLVDTGADDKYVPTCFKCHSDEVPISQAVLDKRSAAVQRVKMMTSK